ncbi:MAG: hypothetical protein ACJ72M_06910 [Propionibacteriaceae bacterium]
MIERCRLFLIIALSETVLTTGTALAQAPFRFLAAVAVLGEDACFEERLDQAQDFLVRDSPPHPVQQGLMVDLVEACGDVGLEHPSVIPDGGAEVVISAIASWAHLRGRKPYEDGWKSASKIGSNTNFSDACTTRSAIVGIPANGPCRRLSGSTFTGPGPGRTCPSSPDREDRRAWTRPGTR